MALPHQALFTLYACIAVSSILTLIVYFDVAYTSAQENVETLDPAHEHFIEAIAQTPFSVLSQCMSNAFGSRSMALSRQDFVMDAKRLQKWEKLNGDGTDYERFKSYATKTYGLRLEFIDSSGRLIRY